LYVAIALGYTNVSVDVAPIVGGMPVVLQCAGSVGGSAAAPSAVIMQAPDSSLYFYS